MIRLLTFTTALLLAATAGAAEPITIAAGQPGRGYDTRAHQIAQRLAQRGFPAEVTNLAGSDEISLALCGGRADMGLMQIDAIYARGIEGCAMKQVALYGTEYGLILFPPRSRKNQLSDLGEGDRVLIDTIGSGSDLFWRTIVRIELGDQGSKDSWAKAEPVNDLIALAPAAAEMGEISAVVLVRKPDAADITRLLDAGWRLGELWDKDINDLRFNGTSLYLPEKLLVRFADRRAQNWGYAVRSFICVTPAVAAGDRARFVAIAGASQ